jgi:5-methylcytosine-specific restriction endonuclease McrA
MMYTAGVCDFCGKTRNDGVRIVGNTCNICRKNIQKQNAKFASIRYKNRALWNIIKEHYCPGNRCMVCGRKVYRISADHIVPSGMEGSTNDLTNLQPLCTGCNNRKGRRVKDYRPDKGEFIRQLLQGERGEG